MSIAFLISVALVDYARHIYPKLPAAYGGSKIVSAEMYSGDTSMSVRLIQESKEWILYVSQETGKIHKIKTSEIQKIEYK